MPALSVVIPTTARDETLRRVLSGLERQRGVPRGLEVVVASDAASEDAGAAARAVADVSVSAGGDGLRAARHVTAPRPGASAARNAGWQAAEAPVVLFLDDDILPTRRLAAEHAAWHECHPEPAVGVLGRVAFTRRRRMRTFARWVDRGFQFHYRSIPGTEAGWGQLYSCNASLKRELLERVGGYDEEAFPFGYEDLDLAKRLLPHGFRLLYNRRARGVHLRPESVAAWEARAPRIARSERRFVDRYPDVRPYFYEQFAQAALWPRASGRGARLAPLVPPWLPWIGWRVWMSVDMTYRQRLAPAFLSAWNATWDDAPPP